MAKASKSKSKRYDKVEDLVDDLKDAAEGTDDIELTKDDQDTEGYPTDEVQFDHDSPNPDTEIQESELETGDTEIADSTDANSAEDNVTLDDPRTEDQLNDDTLVATAPEVQPEPEPAALTKPPVTSAPQVARSSGFWPLVFGGVVAAMLGFILGRADQFDAYLPASMQRQTVDLSVLEAQTEALATQNQSLTDAISELQNVEPAATPDPFDATPLENEIAALTARIAELEARPVAAPVEGGSPELEALVGTMQSTISQQADEIAALKEGVASVTEAEQSIARRTLAQAALARVSAAIDTGSSYAPALADLEATGIIDIPASLAAPADDGVPTLASLATAFPDAARNALAAARSEEASAGGVDLGGFLRRQLGARSVMPREGDDPDAVLSRAEAALKAGDLNTAVTEIETLPEAAKAELASWLEQAQTRQTALDAANALAQSLTTN